MAVLICGSMAFDTIMTFEGRLAEQILPVQLHILNVSFLVPTLRRDFGGCAGNIAYALKLLGGDPRPMAMLGSDGADYLQRLRIETATVVDILETMNIQREFGLLTNDALLLAVARRLNVTSIASADKALSGITGFAVYSPGDLEA